MSMYAQSFVFISTSCIFVEWGEKGGGRGRIVFLGKTEGLDRVQPP